MSAIVGSAVLVFAPSFLIVLLVLQVRESIDEYRDARRGERWP